MEDVARVLSLPIEQQVKTMVVARRDGGMALCGIRPDARLNLGGVARALGVSRSSLALAPPDAIEERLGMPPGAVGLVTGVSVDVLLAESFADVSELYFGAGRHDRTLKAKTEPLVAALGVRFGDIESPG
jgi:prolyl-tRNA editing enzyme YbaK/EbsC (Cys-tRNA(Pro) deacylase)